MSRESKGNQPFEEGGHLSILEAVENLSNIADMDMDDKLGLIEDHVIVQGLSEDEALETIQWLEDKSEHQTEKVVEETYKAVLKYVKDFHEKEFSRFYDQKNQEGIKKIMLLVGKASDKLSNFTHLFKGVHQKGVEEIKEYQQLNKFYNERVAIEEGEKVSLIDLSRKDRQLEARKHPQVEEDENTQKSRQFHLDVTKAKEDENYELLFIQRDDGSRYMEPNFYRNIKVACNFGEYVGKQAEIDPIEGLKHWADLSQHKSAIRILRFIKPFLSPFYKDALKYKDMDIVSQVNMAIMSLMLAANPKNRSHLNPQKPCSKYFEDFHHYLRGALTSFEYNKMRSFPPPASSVFLHVLINMINLLSWALFYRSEDLNSLSFVVDDMLEEGKVTVKKSGKKAVKKEAFFKNLQEDYLYIQRYLMKYPVGPLFKTLNLLGEGQGDSYDPFALGNLPAEFQAMNISGQELSLLRLPTPTNQELIGKVQIDQEFTGLIDAFSGSNAPKKHLMINLQDRTSWKEYSRASFLEKLPNHQDYVKFLNTITLSKSSDFYHQSCAYEELNQTKDFFKQLVFHLRSEETGFYFPAWLQEEVFNGFVEKAIGQIHRFFFDGKSVMSVEERQNFIEIFYQLLTLKILEISESTSMSFTCKDALDAGACQTLAFYSFLKLISNQEMGERDRQKMHLLLFAIPILQRNRPTQAEGFLRMIRCLECVEKNLQKHSEGQFHKVFGSLYEWDLSEVNFIKPSLESKKKREID